jgi:uncharacterized damage-inducible protein DinB
MKEQLLETWKIHNNINLYLLESLQENHLTDVSASKGRSVGAQFSHVHNVRLMWLKASSPDLLEGLQKIEEPEKMSRKLLGEALQKSYLAIQALLRRGFDEGKIKGFKPHPAAFLGYLISHESHHRGQILLSLKQSGHPVDKKVAFGIWEWGVR